MDAEAPTEIQRPPIPAIASSREQCSACGAALAPDQRYCVECGQRRGGAQPPFFSGPQLLGTPSGGAQPRRPLMSINATLLAGIGTLLLAMGIGILIGRSGQGSNAKTPAVQLVTAGGTSAAGTSGTTGTSPEAALPGSSTTPTGTTATKSTGSSSTPKPKPKSSRPPVPKAVKVGNKGSGPGYEKGKFTGNFFGKGEE